MMNAIWELFQKARGKKPPALGHSSHHAIRRSAQTECRSAPERSIANVFHLRNALIVEMKKRDRSIARACDPKGTSTTKQKPRLTQSVTPARNAAVHSPRKRRLKAAQTLAELRLRAEAVAGLSGA